MEEREIQMKYLITLNNVYDQKNVCLYSLFSIHKYSRLLFLNMAAIIACFMVNSVAAADVFEDGLNAFGGAKYEEAYYLWKPLAEKGNAAAQYYMGVMYANGQGVVKDNIVAYAWYSVAAEEQDMAEENRDDIVSKLSLAQLEQAKKLAKEFNRKYLP